MLCVFSGVGFWEFPLIVLAFFSVLLVLGFCAEGFSGRALAQEWGGGEWWIFV